MKDARLPFRILAGLLGLLIACTIVALALSPGSLNFWIIAFAIFVMAPTGYFFARVALTGSGGALFEYRPLRWVPPPPEPRGPMVERGPAPVRPLAGDEPDLFGPASDDRGQHPTKRESVAAIFRKAYVLGDVGNEPPVVRLVDLVLSDALRIRTSLVLVTLDTESNGKVEYLIAGTWRQVMSVPGEATIRMINRLKVMAVLDAGHLPVQEGELHVRDQGQPLVLRIRTETTSSPFERVFIGIPPEFLSARHSELPS